MYMTPGGYGSQQYEYEDEMEMRDWKKGRTNGYTDASGRSRM